MQAADTFFSVITPVITILIHVIFLISAFLTLQQYYFLLNLSFKCDVRGGGEGYVSSQKKVVFINYNAHFICEKMKYLTGLHLNHTKNSTQSAST